MASNRVRQVNDLEYTDACKAASARWTHVVWHHFSRPRARDYRGRGTWNGVWNYHVHNRGWSDIGYHAGVGPDGSLWLLRHADKKGYRGPLAAFGAHCKGHNGHGLGMALAFDGDSEDPAACGYDRFCMATAWFMNARGMTPDRLYFHRQFANKSCPGRNMDLNNARSDVARLMAVAAPPAEGDYIPDLPQLAVVVGSHRLEVAPKKWNGRLWVMADAYVDALGACPTDDVLEGVQVHASGYAEADELTAACGWIMYYHRDEVTGVDRYYPKRPEWVAVDARS